MSYKYHNENNGEDTIVGKLESNSNGMIILTSELSGYPKIDPFLSYSRKSEKFAPHATRVKNICLRKVENDYNFGNYNQDINVRINYSPISSQD